MSKTRMNLVTPASPLCSFTNVAVYWNKLQHLPGTSEVINVALSQGDP